MDGIKKAKELIRHSRSVAITGHRNPDGDSIGSMLALGAGLEKMGKHVTMVSCDGVPRRYRKLPGARKIVRSLRTNPDIAITVDSGSRDILGIPYSVIRTVPRILEIDHHEFREPFGDVAFIDPQAAAVGEMVFALLKEIGVPISKNIAQNLMTSIIVETNSFRLPNARAITFEVCAELIRHGVDFYTLAETVYWSRTPSAALLTGVCLSRCRFLKRGRLVWSIARGDDFVKAGGAIEDVDAVPDEMRAIGTVQIAVFFREKDNKTLRVSLRSKGSINIAGIAERYNGGGHFDVAGCVIPNNSEAIADFLQRTGQLLD